MGPFGRRCSRFDPGSPRHFFCHVGSTGGTMLPVGTRKILVFCLTLFYSPVRSHKINDCHAYKRENNNGRHTRLVRRVETNPQDIV
jgi:hypothetical protein